MDGQSKYSVRLLKSFKTIAFIFLFIGMFGFILGTGLLGVEALVGKNLKITTTHVITAYAFGVLGVVSLMLQGVISNKLKENENQGKRNKNADF